MGWIIIVEFCFVVVFSGWDKGEGILLPCTIKQIFESEKNVAF